MLEAMGDHEFYCSCYSSKEAPHIDGLWLTLADGLEAKTRDIAAARENGEIISVQDFLLSEHLFSFFVVLPDILVCADYSN